MPTGNSKYKTLDSVVRGALDDMGYGMSRYAQFLRWGLKGLREWHSDIAKEVKTTVLPMDDTKKIDFPDDFVMWTKIGIKCGNVIKTFTNDEKMTFHNAVVEGQEVPNEECSDVNLWNLDTSVDDGYAFWNYDGDQYPMFGFAYQKNNLGYFRVHWDEAEIQFRAVIPSNSEIILEYISDGWDPNVTTLLHPYAVELITLYIHWQHQKFRMYNRAGTQAALADARNEYEKEYERTADKMFELTVEDVLEVSREAFRQSPKS